MEPHHHDHGGHGWQEVFGPISIFTVPTYAARKKVMDACSRAVVRYWHEVEGEARHEKDEGDEKNSGDGEKSNAAQQDTPGRASDDPPKDNTMGDEGKDSQPSQKVWEIKTFSSASQKTSQDYVAAARLNRFLTKAVPSYNEGEESGIENWVARFKFE